jgi:hypothetical protein
MEKAKYQGILLLLFGCLFFSVDICGAEDVPVAQDTPKIKDGSADKTKEIIYIVKEYRYEPGDSGGDHDIGQALCGTRCNALSVDYQNYLKPPGWRMIKIAGDRELSVALNNPFIGGTCICVADEYLIKVNNLYMSK